MNMNRIPALPQSPTRGFWRLVAEEMRLLFGRPPRMQFAALCFRRMADGSHEVMLITSRDTGRWVTPKGWPMDGCTAAEVAEREAFEEAGVRGAVSPRPIGRFSYAKGMRAGLKIRCIVQVHALEVERFAKKFREKGQRTVSWFSPDDAAEQVQEPGLKRLILAFRP